MIKSRQYFCLGEKCVIEKLLIVPPFRLGAVFQNEACFLYFKEEGPLLNAPTEKIKLYRNEGVLLKCGNYFADFIRQGVQGSYEIYAIHLYPEVLKDIYRDEIPAFIKPSQKPFFAQKIEQQDITERFIESLLFYFDHPQLVNEELLRLKLKELILLLLQTKNADTILELISHLFMPRKASISEVLHTHLFSSLSMEELARLCGLSLSSFKREFKKLYGESPARYIREKRLEKARELLEVSAYSVSEIAFQLGFSDPGYFAKSFHEKWGCSPTDYRKALKESAAG